jgi:hypothetical protein
MGWAEHVARMGDKREGIGGKVLRRVTTRKTEAQMEEWDQNGSWGDWLKGEDSAGSR